MSSLEDIKKQIKQEVRQARHVMLVSHQKPDGDTAGACLAIAHYLEELNKKFTCFCLDELSSTLKFLPKSHKWENNKKLWHQPKFDLLIVLDSGDLRHAGIEKYIKNLTHDFKIINIDHHPTNEHFGDYNLVIHDASSTCEIIHDLLKSEKALNQNIATCLLTGIMTDTGGFSNAATTSEAVKVAGELLLYGANLKQIQKNTLYHRPVSTLKLWGRALERLQLDKKTGFIMTFITQADLDECNGDAEALEGVSNFLNNLEEAKKYPVMVLSEREPGIIKASLRTTSSLIDVGKFAKLLGGGGHKKAAGFSMKGSLIKTKNGWQIKTNQKSIFNPDGN